MRLTFKPLALLMALKGRNTLNTLRILTTEIASDLLKSSGEDVHDWRWATGWGWGVVGVHDGRERGSREVGEGEEEQYPEIGDVEKEVGKKHKLFTDFVDKWKTLQEKIRLKVRLKKKEMDMREKSLIDKTVSQKFYRYTV